MSGPSPKDLSVFEFKDDDFKLQDEPSKYCKRLRSSNSSLLKPNEDPLTKYQFLQFQASGPKKVEVTDTSCIDLSEDGSSEGSLGSEENSESDEIMQSPKSRDEERENLPPVTAVSSPLVPTVDNEHVSWLQSDEYTGPGFGFRADYVTYQNTQYGDATLIFTPDTIKVDATVQTDEFLVECAVDDIIHIGCQWSKNVDVALVKIRMKRSEQHRDGESKITHDVEELVFAVTGLNWGEKEQKIKSLATRYEDAWNVHEFNDSRQHDKFFPDHYFEIPDSFEDVIYPKGDPDAVSITRRDIEQLQPDTFLNDTIIDFYIKYLKGQILPTEKHRFHFFNSFFFRKLADLDKDPGSASEGRAAFLRVRKWTRKVDIFGKDYIFIPVNFNYHWSLLVICHPGEAIKSEEYNVKDLPKVPCIVHMDSIKGSHSGLKDLLQSYIWEEWKERNPEAPEEHSSKFLNLRFFPVEVPQQDNSFDCGLFLLHYVELFLQEAPLNFNPFKVTKFSKFLTADWFSPYEASLKRYVIRKLISDLLFAPQKVTSTDFCDESVSLVDCQNVSMQEPAPRCISEQCGVSKTVLDSSLSFVTNGRNQVNHVKSTTSTTLLKIEATSMSSPKHQVKVEDNAHPTKESVSSVLESHQRQPCLTSYYAMELKVPKLPQSCFEEEICADLLLITSSSDQVDSQTGELENSACITFVPDSNTSSPAENEIIDTSKTENSTEDNNNPDEAKTGKRELQEIDMVDCIEDSQEIISSDAKGGDTIGRSHGREASPVAENCELDTKEATTGQVDTSKGEQIRDIQISEDVKDTMGGESRVTDTKENKDVEELVCVVTNTEDALMIDNDKPSEKSGKQDRKDEQAAGLPEPNSKRRRFLDISSVRRSPRSITREPPL